MSDSLPTSGQETLSIFEAIQQFSSPVWLVDKNLCLVDYNPAFCSFCAASVEKKMSLFDIPGFQEGSWAKLFASGLREAFVHPKEKFGEKNYYLTFSPLKIGGETSGVLVFAKELSEEDLSTLEFAESALIYRVKSEFMANMNHTLRTPLNHVIGYAEMLIEDIDDLDKFDIIQDLTKIRAAGRQLLGLINNIISLARAESERSVLAIEKFPIKPLLIEVLKNLCSELGIKKERLTIDCPDHLELTTDLEKFRHVVRHLLHNAFSFSKKGVVNLCVFVEHSSGNTILIIENLKKEIKPEQVLAINQALMTPGHRSFPREAGVGFGLMLVSKYCELIDGRVSVSSEPGKGSTFTVSIPILSQK